MIKYVEKGFCLPNILGEVDMVYCEDCAFICEESMNGWTKEEEKEREELYEKANSISKKADNERARIIRLLKKSEEYLSLQKRRKELTQELILLRKEIRAFGRKNQPREFKELINTKKQAWNGLQAFTNQCFINAEKRALEKKEVK